MRSVLDRSDREDDDYINRIVLTLPLSVYEGTWTTLSPLVAMHHHDLACAYEIFEITTFPNSGIRGWFYALMLCTSRTQVSCGR